MQSRFKLYQLILSGHEFYLVHVLCPVIYYFYGFVTLKLEHVFLWLLFHSVCHASTVAQNGQFKLLLFFYLLLHVLKGRVRRGVFSWLNVILHT